MVTARRLHTVGTLSLNNGTIFSVSASPRHGFSKAILPHIRLVEGLGVEGDTHIGATVRHRFLARKNPRLPNRRQVHLIQNELFDELGARGFEIEPGQMGENITTRGIDLLGLPTGARLHLGPTALLELTGLRSPCVQLDRFRPGLKAALLDHDAEGRLIRKAGVMSIVVRGGDVQPGELILVELPACPWRPLRPV